jgi:hypothetical protein
MKRANAANYLSWIAAFILAFIPFHAFLTVGLSGILGHYTFLRLWKEFLLLVLAAGAIYLLAKDSALRKNIFSSIISRLIAFYILLNAGLGLAAYALDNVTLKAFGYGLIVNLRFLIYFLCVWIIATKSPILSQIWSKLLLIPAGIVVIAGILQRLVLPYDFLKHFGYSSNTIFPYETINHNIKYPRVMSTLRGANPLGAYLVLAITAAADFFFKDKKRRLLWGIFFITALTALIFSYSRSAWIGLVLSLLFLGWINLSMGKIKKILLPAAAIFVIISTFLITALRHNSSFENIFLHTQTNSTVKVTSNEGHISAFKDGISDIVHEPFGQGTGTAGPASVYNNNVRISENYYLQIAQELGWAGMILFIIINYLIACELWRRKSGMLAQILLASLIGITFINLLSHAWTDDTLSYIWWGLAGICLAPILAERQKAHGKKIKAKS